MVTARTNPDGLNLALGVAATPWRIRGSVEAMRKEETTG
jgi:hypothetical protein